jgi:enoyl-CoA hydratase
MAYENILIEQLEGHVGLIRLNRPTALNALNAALMTELAEALKSMDQDAAIHCIVITGSDKAFAAGADIKEMSTRSAVEMLVSDSIGIWDRVALIKKPIIAAVSGWCLGGGNELAMACDMIVASKTAKFGQPEINIGVIPGAGGTQRLTRAVGKTIAMEMILNDRRLTADEAYQFGLVNRVSENYLEDALQLARDIARRAPLAVRIAKESINRAFETPLATGVAAERRDFYFLFATEDQHEGMDAFVNKREAQWKGK